MTILTLILSKALNEKNFAKAFELRGPMFQEMYKVYRVLQGIDTAPEAVSSPSPISHKQYHTHTLLLFPFISYSAIPQSPESLRIAVFHMGGVSPGMNDALRSCVRWGLSRGHKVGREERANVCAIAFSQEFLTHFLSSVK